MAVGGGANGFDRVVSAHGVFGGPGTLQQEVEQTIQVCVRLSGELDRQRHLRSCFTRTATFASSFDRTTSDGMEIPVRSYRLERGDRTKTLWGVGVTGAAGGGGRYEGRNVSLVQQGSERRVSWLDTNAGKTDELQCRAR
jgi:hypothetical protein